jgi:hypothetical protein
MALPIRFRNVHYYLITGRYTFAGDLFIAHDNLYFFPEVDLDKQREEVAQYLPHDLALVITLFVYLAQRLGSYVSRTEFWQDGLDEQTFRKQAAIYIESLKAQRRLQQQEFGKVLPLPIHVRTTDISNLRLTPRGKLSFAAQSDTHDFNIGVFRRKQLRNGLWEAGLGRV